MGELKKCPFCGSKAKLYGVAWFFVSCTNKLCSTSTDTTNVKEEAINTWNTRQPEFNWKPVSELTEDTLRKLDYILLSQKHNGYELGWVDSTEPDHTSIVIDDGACNEYLTDIQKKYDYYALLISPKSN